jgi:hypothetical protein
LDFLAIAISIKSRERNEDIIAHLVTVLMERTTRMHISEVDALEILDAGRFSAGNANVVDEQSLPAGFLPRSGGRASVDDGESRAPTLEAELGDLGGAAAGTQINQVKVVYRKHRLLQKAV